MYLLLAAEVAPWVNTLCTISALLFMVAMPALILWLTKKVKILKLLHRKTTTILILMQKIQQ